MRSMALQGQTPGQAAEAFATALFDAWGPGDRRCHNGAILLLSVEDRQVRSSSRADQNACTALYDKLAWVRKQPAHLSQSDTA